MPYSPFVTLTNRRFQENTILKNIQWEAKNDELIGWAFYGEWFEQFSQTYSINTKQLEIKTDKALLILHYQLQGSIISFKIVSYQSLY